MSAYERLQAREVKRTAAIRALIGDRVDLIAAAEDFGVPSAAKRGRNPRWPFVPVVKFESGRTQQLRGLAYSTREDAVARAERQIDARRQQLARDLCRPNMRALREQHGLPRDPLEADTLPACQTQEETPWTS